MLLAVSPFRNTNKDEERGGEMSMSMSMSMSMFSSSETTNDFVGDFDEDDASLLESINFDDIFVGIDVDADDILPDLEMDPEIFAAFSDVTAAASSSVSPESNDIKHVADVAGEAAKKEDEDKMSSASGSGSESGQSSGREECAVVKASRKEGDRGRKSSAQSSSKNNNSQGKRKVKVDWTPELHRRFVQAVEQLGVDKAVPSRILEIMGIDCLTRHNIASHLQKYRSHRKHLLAREAEAANWSKRRHHHQSTTLTTYGVKRESPSPSPSSGPGPWAAATIGFPPPMHHFRPLHVWGHPTMDHSFMPLWPPKHSPASPSYWHPQRGPNTLTPGTPCFPQPLTASTTRLPTQPAVPGIPPPHAMYKVDPSGVAVPAGQSGPRPLIDFHPSKESIDAAIGDVLSKPSLPLPLGLKAPSLDIVMGELQRQGIPKIPPSCA